MAAATSSASPGIVRTQSSHAQTSYSSPLSGQPTRTRSTAQRPTSSSHHSHRSTSRSHPHDAPPTSHQAVLASVAQKDFETTNVAKPPSSRRSSSQDRPPEYRSEEIRSHQRTSSRPRSSRNSTEFSAASTVVNGGSVLPQQAHAITYSERPSVANQQPSGRRRTSITTSTGTWLLGKTIGQGSMGKVKLAKNVETSKQVAIKIVPRQATDEHGNPKDERADRSKEVRTAREAAMVSLLNHPFICGMRDVQRTDFHWYMLFEYVNGGQMLDYIISHGRLKEKQARKFGRQIASALDYCHRNSIVHRDLKIENILISKTGDIKIIDFGLSNLFSPRSLLKTFCGSLYFAAPELLQARQYTGPEVDVWSFGIVLYVLVCGKVPFDDQSMPQLHAKIKRGVVEYPPWLSPECKSIIARMLVVDPRDRAVLQEIMNHPWMTKGFNNAPENYLPVREPLQLPLDPEVIDKMTGFDFGSASYITTQLRRVLESEEYQSAVRRSAARDDNSTAGSNEKKRGVFDFYKRRNSVSREGLTAPSSEAIRGIDPVNAYSPIISIYYLAREKRDRERKEANPVAVALPTTPGEPPLQMPGLPQPEAAHTNQHAYEIPGEQSTGGRSRPRARTQGDEEVVEDMRKLDVNGARMPPSSYPAPQPPAEQTPKRERTAMGLLRRLSTRRPRERDADRQLATAVTIQPPGDLATPPRKSFSVRRSRRRDPSPSTLHPGGSQPQHEGLLSAPQATSASSKAKQFLARSTSVNSADYRPRKLVSRNVSEAVESSRPAPEPPQTSGSDRSSMTGQKPGGGVDLTEKIAPNASPLSTPRTPTSNRTKSLGHARRESIQARRLKREEANRERAANVPEETDAELNDAGDTTDNGPMPDTPGAEISRPVYLKGLFSVQTTSNKPVQFIRQDIIRVLTQLGVNFTEIKGGFSCRHAPSINLDTIRDQPNPVDEEKSGRVTSGHQRRISFGLNRTRERDESRDEKPMRNFSRRGPPDRSFVTNSEGSDEYIQGAVGDNADGPRDMAATTTRIQSDTGENLILRFEIAIVKILLLTLHGLQFKKIQGGMNQYKQMTQRILDSLRL